MKTTKFVLDHHFGCFQGEKIRKGGGGQFHRFQKSKLHLYATAKMWCFSFHRVQIGVYKFKILLGTYYYAYSLIKKLYTHTPLKCQNVCLKLIVYKYQLFMSVKVEIFPRGERLDCSISPASYAVV